MGLPIFPPAVEHRLALERDTAAVVVKNGVLISETCGVLARWKQLAAGVWLFAIAATRRWRD
jgi:hypothetical protein